MYWTGVVANRLIIANKAQAYLHQPIAVSTDKLRIFKIISQLYQMKCSVGKTSVTH